MNLLQKLSEKSLGKRGRMKVGFSFTYNSYIFPRNEYINYMNKFSCNVWEVIGQEVTKNGEEYESDYTKNFFQIYGSALVKAQEN